MGETKSLDVSTMAFFNNSGDRFFSELLTVPEVYSRILKRPLTNESYKLVISDLLSRVRCCEIRKLIDIEIYPKITCYLQPF